MHRTPEGTTPVDVTYASSKWSQAITAIEGLVSPERDDTIRFGVELWPREEPGCITLAERITDMMQATNPSCSDGEVLVSPAIGTSASIGTALDPLTTKICASTPTGAGLLTGAAHLATIEEVGRDQYLMLVTDGADWDQTCPTPYPVTVAQQLAANGIKTFILGFSASGELGPNGIGAPFLNDMACAGMTAPDLDTNCVMGTTGYTATDPAGPTLYLQASDGAALSAALAAIAVSICCDCIE
ncbi:MAG: vWA domain-containing protein [Polyangiaceae bacterium]